MTLLLRSSVCAAVQGCKPRRSSLFSALHQATILLVVAGAVACSLHGADTSPNGAKQPDFPEDGQWITVGKNPANTRYSSLDKITVDNAKNLRVAWSFSTGINRGQEPAPIVAGKTMYVVTPYPNILYALDLEKSGAIKWSYLFEPSPASQGVACCDVLNRGAVVSGDIDVCDPTASGGFANAVSDLPQHTTRGRTLYVFSLP